MVSRIARILLMWGAAVLPIETASANETVAEKVQPPLQRQALLLLPLEEVLSNIAQTSGISFIFDSRLVQGKRIAPIEGVRIGAARTTTSALRQQLKQADLKLHKVNATTYAITAQPAVTAPVAAPAVTNVAAATPLTDTIIVTATAATAFNIAGDRNLFVFDREALDNLAVINPAEAVYELPQTLASLTSANTSFFGATAGINLADLRGFGPQRTMVLVNGRRRTDFSGGNGAIIGFDLSALAEPFLERVEFSSEFGGARYGPRAAAGAINFVTKRNITGFETGVRYGISERGDAEEFSIHALGGRSFLNGAATISAGVNHTRENGLLGADRALTSTPYGFAIDGVRAQSGEGEFLPGFAGSTTTPTGLLGGVITNDGTFIPAVGATPIRALDGAGGLVRAEPTIDQLYNWLADTSTIIPVDRTLGYIDASWQITPTINLFAEAHLGVAKNRAQIAPVPATNFQGVNPLFGDGAPIPLNNPTIPDGIRQFVTDTFGPDASALVISRRYEALGPRLRDVDRRYNELVAGLDAELGERTNFQATYRYGRNVARTAQRNRVDRNRLLTALDEAECAATPECELIDLFFTGGVSENAADFLRAPPLRRQISLAEHEISALLQTRFNVLSVTDAALSLGGNWRRTLLDDRNLSADTSETLGVFVDNNFDAALNTGEFHTALEAPLIDEQSPVGGLDLRAAYRLTASPQFSTAHNIETMLTWTPTPSLILFAAYGYGDRTPAISELFTISRSVEGFFTDPCARGNSAFNTNCNSDHPLAVPQGFVQTDFLALQTEFGNPDLEPEEVHIVRAGLTVQPTQWTNDLPGQLSISAHWLSYEAENVIDNYSNVLEECFASENFSNPACGVNPLTGRNFIERSPLTGQITTFGDVLQNDGSFSWRGLDLEAQYSYAPPAGPIDRLWFRAIHTYNYERTLTQKTGAPIDEAGLIDFPHHQSLFSAGANAGPVSLAAFAQRRGRAVTQRFDIPQVRVPAVTTFDLTANIHIGERAVATLAIENLTDRDAPLAAFSDGINTFPQYYDIIGRRFQIGVRASF